MIDWCRAPVAIPEGEREIDPNVGASVESIDEPDAEHEDLPVEEEPWPGLLEHGMNLLRDALQADEPSDARQRLVRFLRTMEDYELWPEQVSPTTFGDPALSILAQHKAYRICRTTVFCPVAGCTKRMASVSRLMGRVRRDHGVKEGDSQDLVRSFHGMMLPGRLKINLQRTMGHEYVGNGIWRDAIAQGACTHMRHTIEQRGICSSLRTCGRTSRHWDGSGALSARSFGRSQGQLSRRSWEKEQSTNAQCE
jgi:hypothetical protein